MKFYIMFVLLLFYMQCMLYHLSHLDYSHNKDLNKSLLKMTHKKLAENSDNTANFTFSNQSKALGMELQNFQSIIFSNFQFDWTNLLFSVLSGLGLSINKLPPPN